MSGEFDIIEKYFAPLSAGEPGAFGLRDDAAIVTPVKGTSLVITADAIASGVHFLPDDPPDQIARKLLRVNLSDLAAKGATPRGYLLTCAFPRSVQESWIAAFARGLKTDQKAFGLVLMGGDTITTRGPAVFSATMFGEVKNSAMLRRDGARPGDLICVTGTIGDAGAGLTEIRKPHPDIPDARRKYLAARYRLPQPRLRLGAVLPGLASAALDVSDGLVQDIGHIATQSRARAVIDLQAVPLSPTLLQLEKKVPGTREKAVRAGDDYEIAFTISPARLKRLKTLGLQARTRVSVIGRMENGQGVSLRLPDGREISPVQGGYNHFRR